MTETNPNLLGSAFLDVLYIIAKARKFLIVFISLFVLGALILGLITPKVYKATSSVVPAEQSDLLSSIGGMGAAVKSFSSLKGLSSLSGGSELDKYIAVLKSSSMRRDLITTFNLRKVYKLENKPYWQIEKELSGNLEFEIADEGNLNISVLDEDPVLAARMANYLVDKLNQVNSQLHVTNAKSIREFIEKRYLENVNDISNLEARMKEFQQKNGVIAVPEQLDATIKTMATLYGDLAKQEVSYNIMKKTLDSTQPALQNKQIEVEEIRKKLNSFTSNSDQLKDNKVFVSIKKAPELVGEYLKIYKNLEIQYKISEFIIPVYEQSKIEEARNTPSVLILDKAYTPELKVKPKITLYILIGFAVSFIIGIFLIFFWEMLRKLKRINPQKFEYIEMAFRPFTKFLPKSF
jgi:tyrosine-protein kinase Etk/Wzc